MNPIWSQWSDTPEGLIWLVVHFQLYLPKKQGAVLGVSSSTNPLLLCAKSCACVTSPLCGMPELAQLYVYSSAPPPLNSVGLTITSPSLLSFPLRQKQPNFIGIQDEGMGSWGVYVHSGRTFLGTRTNNFSKWPVNHSLYISLSYILCYFSLLSG